MVKLSRQESKQRTRQALIDAILEVLSEDGLEGLTTTAVARRAGVAQSSFYVHFESMDAALEVAAVFVTDRMQEAVQEERKNMTIANPMSAIRSSHAAALSAFLANPGLGRLYIRYRRSPSSLGVIFRRLEEEAKESMMRDLSMIGLTPQTLPHLSIWCDMAIAMSTRCAEGLIAGEYENIEDCLDVLQSMGAHVIMSGMMSQSKPG